VEVGAPAQWLASPERRSPVTVDPVFTQSTAPPSTARDTFVWNANPSTSYSSNPWLLAGAVNPPDRIRSLLWFDLSSLPTGPDVEVVSSHLAVHNWYSRTCTPTPVAVHRLTSPFGPATTWSTQPGFDPVASSSKSFAHGAAGCPAATVELDTTAVAGLWLSGAEPNLGLALLAGG
jgi:hypothetical protein